MPFLFEKTKSQYNIMKNKEKFFYFSLFGYKKVVYFNFILIILKLMK